MLLSKILLEHRDWPSMKSCQAWYSWAPGNTQGRRDFSVLSDLPSGQAAEAPGKRSNP